MANADRPDGFKPVGTISGVPWTGTVRAIGVADGSDIYIGDPITLSSGLAAPSASNDAAFLGVAVGFGKFEKDGATPTGPFNPDNLNSSGVWYDDSANTHTDWCVFYVPAQDTIFEVQTATALTKVVGDSADLSYLAGSSLTGQSACEITTASANDVKIVGKVLRPDNTETAVNGRYLVMFTRAEQALGG